jgi:predicted methyltransferase
VLAPVAAELAALAESAPPARVELDQAHCTVETKLRRVLALYEAGALDERHVLLLGDDDLTALAIRLVVEQFGPGALRGLAVVDVDPALVAYLRDGLRGAPFEVECVAHDLRDPLPERLRGWADTVFTDPPYTRPGAELFLSRAAQATAGRARADVYLAFGPKRPEEALDVQQAIAAMGFTVRSLVRNFNDYLGAGSLGGASHLYHLATTRRLRPLHEGRYDGPLYTGDLRPPLRAYRCRSCGLVRRVGRGRTWPTIGALKRAGCPRCRGAAFVPLPRSHDTFTASS